MDRRAQIMKGKFINKKIDYTGEQLRSKFARKFNLSGDTIVAFIGGANVVEHMVDLEDIGNNEFIFADSMLHFIVEHKEADLEKAVLRQRLLISLIKQLINGVYKKRSVIMDGDDLYSGNRKLSVSIATKSPKTTLIHVGLNITQKGTPVKTVGLSDLGIKPKALAKKVISAYINEVFDIKHATKKVKKVK
ncbi:DUF366 family protein [Candidatus Margulisiibacteriota bacterium]